MLPFDPNYSGRRSTYPSHSRDLRSIPEEASSSSRASQSLSLPPNSTFPVLHQETSEGFFPQASSSPINTTFPVGMSLTSYARIADPHTVNTGITEHPTISPRKRSFQEYSGSMPQSQHLPEGQFFGNYYTQVPLPSSMASPSFLLPSPQPWNVMNESSHFASSSQRAIQPHQDMPMDWEVADYLRASNKTPTPQVKREVSPAHLGISDEALEAHRNAKGQEAYDEIYNNNRKLKTEFLKKPELLNLITRKAPYFNPYLSLDVQIRSQIRAFLDKDKEYYVTPFLKNSNHTEGLPKEEHEEFMKQVLTQVIRDWVGKKYKLFRA